MSFLDLVPRSRPSASDCAIVVPTCVCVCVCVCAMCVFTHMHARTPARAHTHIHLPPQVRPSFLQGRIPILAATLRQHCHHYREVSKETYYKAKETYYKAKETYYKAKETY